MNRNPIVCTLANSKLFINAAAIIIFFISFCTTSYAQTKVGVQVGVNFANINAENESGNKETTRSMPGIRFGLTVDVPVISNLYIQPGIFYAQKGFKQANGGYYGLANNFEVKVSYVELPVNFLYKPKIVGGRLTFGAGPYVAYGTSGTWKSDNVILIGDIMTDSQGKTIFKDDFTEGEFGNYIYGRPWDYGLNFSVGYQLLGHFSAQVHFETGLANLHPKTAGEHRGGSLFNKSLGLTVGYKF